jgi:RNA polymerase sigma-70 factor (ECF subfamily)
MRDDSDRHVVERARTGDRRAAEALVRRHLGTAYGVALAVLADRDEAEDVCQDAMVRMLERLGDCRNPDRFVPWLAEIVRNHAYNRRAYRRVREAASLDHASAASAEKASDLAERGELRRRLERALASLTVVQRLVVILHDMQDHTHREIAQLLRLSETASRQHLFVARKRLRAHLGPALLEDYTHEA